MNRIVMFIHMMKNGKMGYLQTWIKPMKLEDYS